MSLFERFKETKELGFRDEFIKPLLVRMGFIGITSKHGQQEFGKDFVFSELDRFGHLRHMVVQAKHEESINQGKKVDDLITQTKQAFLVPFTIPSSPSEKRYVSAVYIFNSGTITDNAKHQIIESLDKPHAANCHFYSGPQLETLAQSTAWQTDVDVRSRLSGLELELRLNEGVFQTLSGRILPDFTMPECGLQGPMLHGLEAFITAPFMPDKISPLLALQVWEMSRNVDRLNMRLYTSIISPDGRKAEIQILKSKTQETIALTVQLRLEIYSALASLPTPII